ncbi:MAG: hypothetical protein ACLR1T_03085 [Evtepia gabavorous]
MPRPFAGCWMAGAGVPSGRRGEADVYEAHDLSQLILDLHQAGCQVTGLHQRDETLESYYMNLVGGGRDV